MLALVGGQAFADIDLVLELPLLVAADIAFVAGARFDDVAFGHDALLMDNAASTHSIHGLFQTVFLQPLSHVILRAGRLQDRAL
jgi:hypothetical protein